MSAKEIEIEEEEAQRCKVGHDIDNWVVIAVAISALVISLLGFLGNLLTILALPNIRKLRHAATWFVVNLAVTELVFCVTILPMSAAHLIHLVIEEDKLFDDNDRACQMFVFLRFVLIHAELFSIAAIAVNRCVLIAMPKKYPSLFTTKRTIMIIIGIWVFSSFVMAFPLAQVFGSFSYNYCTDECDFDTSPKSKIARKVFLLNGFFIPCVIIILSYSYIFYKSRQSTQRMMALKNEGNSNEVSVPATGLRTRDMRIARTIGVIFLVFLLCCSPVSVAHFYGSEGQIPTTLLLLHPLYWLQYCLNSLIYVLMNKQYREAYISYISVWWPRFHDIVNKWYQETTDDETSTSGQLSRKISTVSKNSYKKGIFTRKISTDTPLPSPKLSPMKMKMLKLNPQSPDRIRKHSYTPSIGKSFGSVESLALKGTYRPILTTTLKVILHNPEDEPQNQ